MAAQKICLRLGLTVRRQFFRGERWIVIEDPFTNQFFRLRPPAYEFVARLRPDKTIEDVWRECLDKFPDEAPGKGGARRWTLTLGLSVLKEVTSVPRISC